MQTSLKHADGEIAIARAEAKAARRSVETVSLQSQLTLAEVEADAAAAKRQAESLQSQLDAIDVYKKSAPSFTDRGKEIQYNHNIGIVNDLTRALTALELGTVSDVHSPFHYCLEEAEQVFKNCRRFPVWVGHGGRIFKVRSSK